MRPCFHPRVLLSIAVIASLVGCAPLVSEQESTAQSSLSDVAQESPTEPDELDEDNPADAEKPEDEAPATVEPDDAIMATMTCVPFDDAQLKDMRAFGVFGRAVSVEVGEKEGVTWWLVAADHMNSDGVRFTRYYWLTDSLEIKGIAAIGGTWIEVRGSDHWYNVDWDEEWLVRAESALEVARAGLSEL